MIVDVLRNLITFDVSSGSSVVKMLGYMSEGCGFKNPRNTKLPLLGPLARPLTLNCADE